MKLTIGMAHHSDFHGVYFTVSALRMYFPHLMPEVEFVVVDQSPDNSHGEKVRGLLGNIVGCAGVKYAPMPEPMGTSPSRDRIFQVAAGDAVLVIDCHVLLVPGALDLLLAYYAEHPGTNDLIQGPLLYDDLVTTSTHFGDVWDAEMWGHWGSAWQCGCSAKGSLFSMLEREGKAAARLLDGNFGEALLAECAYCKAPLPTDIPWAGHEQRLFTQKYRFLAHDMAGSPFPIPGQGLGLFSCRREAWLGFNPHARGFGGEEMYIHGKFRAAGRQTLCFPGLRWLHRFGRPDGVPYPLTRWNKLRNYVLEFQEMGWDLSPVHKHFVETELVSQFAWNELVRDAVGMTSEPQPAAPIAANETLNDVFNKVVKLPRDLDQHLPKLHELAAQCEHVTEFSGRRESMIAFAAGLAESAIRNPQSATTLWSYNSELDPLAHKAHALYMRGGGNLFHKNATVESVPAIDETDLLFLDTKHTYQRVRQELETFGPRSRRYIVLHDTQIYGERGEDGGPGILQAVREFLNQRPEWETVFHTRQQYGLTVLSCRAEDRPAVPVTTERQGPGTELKKLLESLGITASENCPCNARAEEMDNLGVAGCRARREEIVSWLREGSTAWGWRDKLAAAGKAVACGLAFRLNPLDPYPGLLDEAIRRAELQDKESGVSKDHRIGEQTP